MRLLWTPIGPDFEYTDFFVRAEGFDVAPTLQDAFCCTEVEPSHLSFLCLTVCLCQMGTMTAVPRTQCCCENQRIRTCRALG